ncbi:hypothetical protein ENUP19_0344G0016 [Entamoeba nuttalli]|uniref:Uncharacterized protein n=1 Tax=Entamoeba nuttalli TaxID=412467 RepID=A0ABQ0DXI3_9EUKA
MDHMVQYVLIMVRLLGSNQTKYKPFNTSKYMSGILQNNNQGMYYTPPRPNRKETLG